MRVSLQEKIKEEYNKGGFVYDEVDVDISGCIFLVER